MTGALTPQPGTRSVQAAERAARDGDIARHERANAKLKEICEAFEKPDVRVILRNTYSAHVDHRPNGIDIEVKRCGRLVCTISKDPDHDGGDIKVATYTASGEAEPGWYEDPEQTAKRVIQLLAKHQCIWPTNDRLDGYRRVDIGESWKAALARLQIHEGRPCGRPS
jgi:hypothetical protein